MQTNNFFIQMFNDYSLFKYKKVSSFLHGRNIPYIISIIKTLHTQQLIAKCVLQK